MKRKLLRIAIVALLPAVLLPAVTVHAADWPFWRGPEQNGSSRENAVVTSWSLDGENLLWKVPVGGRTTPVVMNGRCYAITGVGEGACSRERVICLDADSGETIWEQAFNVFHSDIVEQRVGWTSVVGDPETGNIYAHGTGGEFFCFDGDGQLLWKRSLTEELGRISGYGGRLHTPIIDEDRVIVSFLNSSWGPHAKPTHRYVAFDKRSGDIVWWAAPGGKPLDTTYAAPVATVIDGRRLLIAATADGNVYGMKARTGERVWSFKLSKRGLNPSVVTNGNYAYICHSEENYDTTEMGAVVCLDASKTGDISESGVVWRRDGLTVGYASPALANDRLYLVTNSATLLCMDAKTGQTHWEFSLGRVGKGSPTVTADGVIYVGEQNGVFHILRDEGDKCVSLDKKEFAPTDEGKDELYGSPAVVGGRVYFMTRYGSYCLGSADASVQAEPIPAVAPETAAGSKAVTMQIVPADVTVSPGEHVQFVARQFDANGRLIKEQSAAWSAAGCDATIDGSGVLTAGTGNAFSAGKVVAKADGLEAAARVRVSPSLPIHESFDDFKIGSVPPGWVGISKKADVVERDGETVLRKLARKEFPSPPFMRLRTYVTPSIKGGYTVQCDMLSMAKKKRFKPDMGLINSRYRMIAVGMGKKLRIESWSPVPRLRHEVPFTYDPDKWYTMKFEVKHEAGNAVVRGKIWPRDENEPDAWTIQVDDPCPNPEGSAGLYAYSAGTTSKSDGPETFFDNLTVERNE